MNSIRNKGILLLQALFLLMLSLSSFILFKNNSHGLWHFILWLLAIIVNLSFLKTYALPSQGLLKKIRNANLHKDLSWIEIEEIIIKKDIALNKQKVEFELENLKYKRLLDLLQDPVCILTKDLVVVYANEAFIALFNFPEKTTPIPLIEITRNLDFQNFLKEAVAIKLTSRKSYFSFNQLQDHHKTYFDLKVFPIDELNNYLCLIHDVSERKMADQVREDFVSNFSHEVRTPLTILHGQMQNLKAQLEQGEDYQSNFGSIFVKVENNSRRLINLFNDLLRLTSVETKKEIIKEEINIEEMLTFITKDLLVNYVDKKIQFTFDLSSNLFNVDYSLFEQVLLNLIDNSLKYSKEIGTIKIKTYHEDQWDHLVIQDNGIGIPEDQLHRIFERFFRVDAGRSSSIEGTGLGLSIVKHIIQKHDGKIKVQSCPNEGTTFQLSFPSI
jgi:two-component system phosphate regulon sensor histidine kinase PhoR